MLRERTRSRLGWIVVLSLLVLASAEFVWRGPVRFAHASSFNDFIPLYIQSDAWRKRVDPYSPANFVRLWPETAERFTFLGRDLADGTLVLKRGIPTAYPPTCWVLLTPFAALPWRMAHAVWLIFILCVYAATVFSVFSLTGLERHDLPAYLFLALALGLAPFHTGLAAGSVAMVAIGVGALATWAADQKRPLLAGILLGIAVGLKPQIGLPFLFFCLLRRRWRVVGTSMTVLATSAAVAILRMAVSHTPWLENYRRDNAVIFAAGSLADFSDKNPMRFGTINLQVLLYAIHPDRTVAYVLALGIAAVLGLSWLWLFSRTESAQHERMSTDLLPLSCLLVLSLLPVYHRLYDASLLIFPLAWSISALKGRARLPARIALILMLVFLLPGVSVLQQVQSGPLLSRWQQSWWWTVVVMAHQVWALFLLSLVLLWAMRMEAESGQAGASAAPITPPN
jgi:Glycosyltransferase family 87